MQPVGPPAINRGRLYTIRHFVKNTKLFEQLQGNYQLDAALPCDIVVNGTDARLFFIKLSYHGNYPRYLETTLKQANQCPDLKGKHIYLILQLDVPDTRNIYIQIQKIALEYNVNLLWGNSPQDCRQLLDQIRLVYSATSTKANDKSGVSQVPATQNDS